MKIVLLERVPKLGQMGDIVEVRAGYARNFLLPTQKALRATDENIQMDGMGIFAFVNSKIPKQIKSILKKTSSRKRILIFLFFIKLVNLQLIH